MEEFLPMPVILKGAAWCIKYAYPVQFKCFVLHLSQKPMEPY